MSMPYRVLALGAGGNRGFLHVGAILELERYCGGNLQKQFSKGVYGTSVGSLMATAVAFGLSGSHIQRLSKKFLNTRSFMPPMHEIVTSSILTQKGCIGMDMFEKTVVEGFKLEGIDLSTKTLGNAGMPLYIVASNITQGIPTIFKKDVPVMTALKASCCLPGIFQPIEYRNQLYIDGDILTPTIFSILPSMYHSESLVLNLRQYHAGITPARLSTMNLLEYTYTLYKISHGYAYRKINHRSSIDLVYAGVSSISEISSDVEDDMILTGKCMVRNFLS